MTAKFTGSWGIASRANLALTLTLLTTGPGLGRQRRNRKRPARPTSTVFAAAKSQRSGPSPPACGFHLEKVSPPHAISPAFMSGAGQTLDGSRA
jgi:hypothetical protein